MRIEALTLTPDPAPTFAEGEVRMHWHVAAPHASRNACGIISLPIQGGDYEVSTHFANYFAKKGFHVLRFERRAEWLDASRPITALGLLAAQYRRDIIRGIDQWLERPDNPTQRLGLMGVSMGAMIGAGVAGMDKRIKASVLCIGGGDMSDVIMKGRDTELDLFRHDLAARLGLDEQALLPRLRSALDPIDGTVYAPNVPRERTLFFGARFDRVVPWRNNRLLWEALGRPRRWVLPCGHYSAAAFVPLIRWLSARHFERWLVES